MPWNFSFLKTIFFLFLSAQLSAFVPPLGQMLRYQANLRKKSLTANGRVFVDSEQLPYRLAVDRHGDYEVEIKTVPRSMANNASAGIQGTWQLQRRGGSCSLRAGRHIYACPDRSPWSLMELSPNSSSITHKLSTLKIIHPSESHYTQSNLKEMQGIEKNPRQFFSVSKNGENYPAVVGVKGLESTELGNQIFPAIFYNQSFFVPMRINYNLGGENVSVVAEYDLYSKEAQARYVAKYAKALEVYGNNGQDLKGSISRSKISTGKAKFNGPRIRPGQSQPFASLQNELSDTGRRFVALLFATH